MKLKDHIVFCSVSLVGWSVGWLFICLCSSSPAFTNTAMFYSYILLQHICLSELMSLCLCGSKQRFCGFAVKQVWLCCCCDDCSTLGDESGVVLHVTAKTSARLEATLISSYNSYILLQPYVGSL